MSGGAKLRHTLRGHGGVIGRVAWSRTGRFIASPSHDGTVAIWDFDTAALVRTIRGHVGNVYTAAFDHTGALLASAGEDQSVRIWNTTDGLLIRELTGHRHSIYAASFSPISPTLVTGSFDGTLRQWDLATGTLEGVWVGHMEAIASVAFDPSGSILASATYEGRILLRDAASGAYLKTLIAQESGGGSIVFSPDGATLASGGRGKAVMLWDVASGTLRWRLEGQTEGLQCLCFVADGKLLAAKCADHLVRVWNCRTWNLVAEIPEPTLAARWWSGIAAHPTLPLLATAGSDPTAKDEQRDTLLHIWELKVEPEAGDTPNAVWPAPSVHYTTAKVVLVGDHSVGKSGLGYRLVHGEFKPQASTHGQQIWLFRQLNHRRQDGTECEAVLWDLAGQPDYRLIHAMFLDDADLALVLFDSANISDPLHGVNYWLEQLKVAQEGCPSILVGAQADRGTPALPTAELEAFCRQHRIAVYVRTSALTGEGLDELIERIGALIPWNDKPATVTTATFKRIKDYLLSLKQAHDDPRAIVSVDELRRRLHTLDPQWQFHDAQLHIALEHLENYGYVKRLRTSLGETRILLKPELLNNLASSLVLEARRNAKGLGSLEEKRLLADGYEFLEVARLSPEERSILLDSVTLLLIEHHICFRETDPLNGESYLVFPELINLKKPPLGADHQIEEGSSYVVRGAVQNVYASLVVLLGYTSTFARINQWQNHARYEVANGGVCGFRLDAQSDGELEFVLYFGSSVEPTMRVLFQSLFETLLGRQDLSISRCDPIRCSKGHRLNRAIVRECARNRRDFAFCSDCGERLQLPAASSPMGAQPPQHSHVRASCASAEQRTLFEQTIFQLQAYVKQQRIHTPDCFVSYAWGVAEHERWVERDLAADLQKAGIAVVLDRWENARIGSSVPRFVDRIEKCDLVLMVGTPLYRKKYENKETSTGFVVAAEVDLIANRLLGTEEQKESVLPLLLAGEKGESLPPLLHGRVHADFRSVDRYFIAAFDLILSLYDIAPNHPAVADLRESLQRQAAQA